MRLVSWWCVFLSQTTEEGLPKQGRRLELNSPRRPDDVDISRFCAAIVLAHPIDFQRQVFVEGVAHTGGEAIAHPGARQVTSETATGIP